MTKLKTHTINNSSANTRIHTGNNKMTNFFKGWIAVLSSGTRRNNHDMHRYYVIEFGDIEGNRRYNDWIMGR